ncbi:MAG: FkbM family methyltransferase [Saprospiraceae bacterium]|nr:FkbM family methyltransferase [Saprospiraceae bacterium]
MSSWLDRITAINRQLISSYRCRHIAYLINGILKKTALDKTAPDQWKLIKNYDGNLSMYVNPNEHIGRRIYFDGYYEGSEWRVLKKLITPSMCIIDIGANIGSWSLLFSKLAQEGTVYAIEPSTWFELLEKNIAINSFKNIKTFQCAFGNVAQEAWIEEPPPGNDKNYGMSRIALDKKSSARSVSIYRLDEFVEKQTIKKIDWIKIDTEGMELEILKGGVDVLKQYQPNVMFEMNPVTLHHYEATSEQLVLFLQNLGYIHFYQAGRRGLLKQLNIPEILSSVASLNVFCSVSPLNT